MHGVMAGARDPYYFQVWNKAAERLELRRREELVVLPLDGEHRAAHPGDMRLEPPARPGRPRSPDLHQPLEEPLGAWPMVAAQSRLEVAMREVVDLPADGLERLRLAEEGRRRRTGR